MLLLLLLLLLPAMLLPRGSTAVECGLPHVVATKARLPGMTVNAASTNASTRSKAGEHGGDRAVTGTGEAAAAAAASARFMTRCCGFQNAGSRSSACGRASAAHHDNFPPENIAELPRPFLVIAGMLCVLRRELVIEKGRSALEKKSLIDYLGVT